MIRPVKASQSSSVVIGLSTFWKISFSREIGNFPIDLVYQMCDLHNNLFYFEHINMYIYLNIHINLHLRLWNRDTFAPLKHFQLLNRLRTFLAEKEANILKFGKIVRDSFREVGSGLIDLAKRPQHKVKILLFFQQIR